MLKTAFHNYFFLLLFMREHDTHDVKTIRENWDLNKAVNSNRNICTFKTCIGNLFQLPFLHTAGSWLTVPKAVLLIWILLLWPLFFARAINIRCETNSSNSIYLNNIELHGAAVSLKTNYKMVCCCIIFWILTIV